MATRKQIRTAFYNALETAAGNYVPASNIGQTDGGDPETFPQIVHSDDYRKIPMNEGSGGHEYVETDTNGNATAVVYQTVHEASFGVVFRDTDEQRREDTYEAVRSYFEKYEHVAWDASDLHADAEWINVLDSRSEDDTDVENPIRGDRLIIRLGFTRDHKRSVDSMDTIGTTVESESYNTT